MPQKTDRDLSRIGWLDYVLMSIGSCFAVYSAGMSLQLPSISFFCIFFVLLGACVSYGVRLLTIKSPFIKLDAFLYSAGVISAIFFSTQLRTLMPDGGFPREMGAAGWLCWMLILGSFATWQDSTLLFQAIPALALFGLIGCYDTYRAVTLCFFAFLLCLTTLFARAHGREMLRKAAASGYFTRGLAPGAPIPSVETTPGLALQLKKGPWRWIAGPEWALASAIAVVLVSLLGAPVIRDSVSSVGGGFVRINQPPIRVRNNQAAAVGSDVSGQIVRIGRPYQNPLPRRLFEVSTDLGGPVYLRSELYDTYTGRGWQNTLGYTDLKAQSDSPLANLGQSRIYDPIRFGFKVHLLRSMHLIPVPQNTIDLKVQDGAAQLLTDGTWQLQNSPESEIDVTGHAEKAKPDAHPTTSPKQLDWANFIERTKVRPRIQQLAAKVTQGLATDYEKALAIQREISRRIVYNLDAEETPTNTDPVEYTLFDLKEGYCTAFASAMVLMARSIGLPARYAQGYLTDNRRAEPNGLYVVTDADYHAWAEVYFDNYGWVTFDPTIGAVAKDGEGLGDTGDPRPWYQKGIIAILIKLVIAVVAAGLVIAGIKTALSYRRVTNLRSELDRAYISFNRSLERAAGRRRKVGQTATEFLGSVGPMLGDSYATAQDLNGRFVAALYSAQAIDLESLARLKADVKLFGGKLRADTRRVREPKP